MLKNFHLFLCLLKDLLGELLRGSLDPHFGDFLLATVGHVTVEPPTPP
jgi:hypothetical protein